MSTIKNRSRMKNSSFAIPSERKYPIPDISHARNALARVAQHGTPSEQRQVKNAGRRKFPSITSDGKPTKTSTKTTRKTGRKKA